MGFRDKYWGIDDKTFFDVLESLFAAAAHKVLHLVTTKPAVALGIGTLVELLALLENT